MICITTRDIHAETTTITVDGNPNDWIELGLNPVGTDPPFNIESYHDICADLLEAWVYNDTENLYFMIKVRGGYPEDWDRNTYFISIDADKNLETGGGMGWEYIISGMDGSAFFSIWNQTTLEFDIKYTLEIAAGDTGYIEWAVPLNYLNYTGKMDLKFSTWDNILKETVNSITVKDICIIPEISSNIIVLALLGITILIFLFRR